MTSGSGGSTVMLKVCCPPGSWGLAKGTALTVKVKVPCWVGVPATIVPAAPKVAGMDRPGGRLPETIVNVLTPPLVRMNSSALCPTLTLGSTQTPLTRVPPLVPGEHSWVSGAVFANAGLAAATPSSNAPAATRVAIVFLIADNLLRPPQAAGSGPWPGAVRAPAPGQRDLWVP